MQVVQRPQRRGAEIFAAQLSAALTRSGHAVRTVYLYPYGGTPRLDPAPGDVLLDGNERHILEKLPGVNPFLLRRLQHCIEEYTPDVVQVNGARTIKYGAFAKRFGAMKPVLVYRNIDNPSYWVKDRMRLWFYRHLVMPQLDGTIGVSEATLQSVQSLYGSHGLSVVIPNGVDVGPLDEAPESREARERLGADPSGKIVLFAGNLTKQKRPDRFLRVLAMADRNVTGVAGWILGDGPMRSELEAYATQAGLAERVRFWGYRADVATYMSAADVLVITSDSDGIPAVVLEAGYLQTPTVATRVGGMRECVVDGETGLLAEQEDEAGLAAAVVRLLEDPAERARMGAAARRWIEGRFTMDVVAGQYVEFYERLLC